MSSFVAKVTLHHSGSADEGVDNGQCNRFQHSDLRLQHRYTAAFAETIGVNVGGGLVKLNTALNPSFTASQNFTTSIAVTDSYMIKDTIHKQPSKGLSSVQYWQLFIQSGQAMATS